MFAPDKVLYPDYDEALEKGMIGETVGFFRHPGRPFAYTPNVLASVDVDVEGFIRLYVERIGSIFA